MPSVQLHVAPTATSASGSPANPLPPLLQTPAGLAIIEIQGSLHTPQADGAASLIDIGRLVFPLYDPEASVDDVKWMRKVHLYVGKHQRLTGEVKKLGKGKSIGVVKKREGDFTSGEEQGLEIVDVVRYKILFQGRPEPVDMLMDS